MFTGLSFTILNAQYFNGVAITSVDSGNGTNNILFSATSSTIPLLAKIRAQVISGSGNFARNGDNFTFTSSVSASASGIPNNKSQIQITFLQSNGTTLIPASDLRFIISDIDGPNNEAIAAGCSSGLKFFGTSPNSNITLTNNSEIRGTGTANQNYEASSTVLLEFSKQNTIIIDTYGNNGYIKEFDLNNNNYALSTTLYTLCNSLDNDGDGITNKNDLDDDNDGILDTAESGIYNPEGDADGDGLPNYLDIVNNAGQSSFFSPDGSSTSYTDANNNGIPDVYDLDGDGLPNHLDTDSDGDGCADAIEGSENVKYNQIHALDLPASDPNYAYRGQIKVTYNGTTTSTPSGIVSNSPSANGVPQLLNNAGNNLNASTNPSNLAGTVDNTDGTADIGQGIGDSQDNTINSCKCYKAPSTDGNNYPTQHGITAFNRAGTDNQNWPMVRQSGWTALEASTKGFVINRMPVSTSGANIGEPVDGSNNEVITSPIAGMMFYDTTNDCLKINVDGTRSGWKCFNNQSCPDEN